MTPEVLTRAGKIPKNIHEEMNDYYHNNYTTKVFLVGERLNSPQNRYVCFFSIAGSQTQIPVCRQLNTTVIELHHSHSSYIIFIIHARNHQPYLYTLRCRSFDDGNWIFKFTTRSHFFLFWNPRAVSKAGIFTFILHYWAEIKNTRAKKSQSLIDQHNNRPLTINIDANDFN